MPRPPLEVGKRGNISISRSGQLFTAKARVRFFDGAVRQVSASGGSEKSAQAALKKKIRNQLHVDASPITSRTPIREVSEMWHQDKKGEGLAYRTLERQRQILDGYVLTRISSLPVGEGTTGRLDRLVKDVARSSGAGTAKHLTRRGCRLERSAAKSTNECEKAWRVFLEGLFHLFRLTERSSAYEETEIDS